MPTLKLFATEQERQMPPEVRLLPKAIWKAYFHHSLTDIEQGLLTAKTPQEISNILQSPERVSGKGTITYAAIILSKLKPLYGDRFHDKLCFTDSKITLVLLNEQALSE